MSHKNQWSKVEMLGYLLTTMTMPIYFYYVMVYLGGRRAEIGLWFWIVSLSLWYIGFMLSGFARYKKHDHTFISLFFMALGILGPIVILTMTN